MKQVVDHVPSFGNQVYYERKEDFDIKMINIEKYDMRKNRSQSSIEDLADDIAQRGQIEYVHIAIIEGEYHLLAGYTRYYALNKLGRKKIRAILYANLSEDEIQSIVTGTNDLRTEITSWDRICNIAKFSIKHPEIKPYTSRSKSEKTLCKIFGLRRSMIYAYLGAYKLIINNKILMEFIENNPNLYSPIFAGLYDITNLIKSDDDTRKVIDIIKTRPGAKQTELVNDVKAILGRKSNAISNLSEEYKWRKAETFVKARSTKMTNVAQVIDVSEQNQGYDLELRCKNGDIYYIEVKKVSSLNDSIEMSNNETSFASSKKDKYIIAIVEMPADEVKQVNYIQDPMNKIVFTPKIVRKWQCKTYSDQVSSEIQIY